MDESQQPGAPGILTHSLTLVRIPNPEPNTLHIDDIAFALSNQCRFAGHVPFYSVAEHSVLVSRWCAPEDALAGLLHDATEAYIQDIPRPIKKLLPGYVELEDMLYSVIAERFSIPARVPDSVAYADNAVLLLERQLLLGGCTKGVWPDSSKFVDLFASGVRVECLQPKEARKLFLDRFQELTS